MPVDDPSKFADRFSIESSRLKNWDYSSPGIYFVTICTLNHNKFFGKIIENKMCLSLRGQIAQQCIVDIPKHFLNVKILDYVVMPNHLHILMETIPLQLKSVETHDRASLRILNNVSTKFNNDSIKNINDSANSSEIASSPSLLAMTKCF